MDEYIEKRLEQLKKSMYKKLKSLNKKSAIEDVLDSNRIAEAKEDDNDPKIGNVVNKKEHECGCEDQNDCECDDVKKAEQFVSNILKNFSIISEAYLQKMEKARSEEGMRPEDKRAMRQARNKGFTPKTKEKFTTEGMRQMPKPKAPNELKSKLQQKHGNKQQTAEIKGFEEEKMAASEMDKKEGVNLTSEDKSDKGGLTQKGRDKYNKATGGNLKAPVSSKEAKKSPKKAARRKSFCARMSGNKGKLYEYKDSNRDGKKEKVPTRKKKALDRWDC